MSTREGISTVREPDRSAAYEGDSIRTDARPGRAPSRRTEKRFEIGFFIRKRVRRAVAYYRQLALLRLRSRSVPAQQHLVAPPPPPQPREEGDEAGNPTVTKAFSVRSGQGQGAPTGDTSDEPDPSTQSVLTDDESGPIEGTSYEIGAFASATTETTTDDP